MGVRAILVAGTTRTQVNGSVIQFMFPLRAASFFRLVLKGVGASHASKKEVGQTELIHYKYYWRSPRRTFYLLRATRLAKKKKPTTCLILLSSKRIALNPLRKAFHFSLSTAILTAHIPSRKGSENFQNQKDNFNCNHPLLSAIWNGLHWWL